MTVGAAVQRLGSDTSILLPCREGDHIAWIRGSGFMGDPSDGAGIIDYWELRAGDRVTITNRFEDLPGWLELCPTEARGSAARALLPHVQAGEARESPMDGPGIWRAIPGDKLAWTGEARPGHDSHDGVLAVFDCSECFLVAGQTRSTRLEDWQFFGAPSSDTPDPDAVAAVRRALAVVRTLGMGMVRIDGWAIG